jgi:hypothetical protein
MPNILIARLLADFDDDLVDGIDKLRGAREPDGILPGELDRALKRFLIRFSIGMMCWSCVVSGYP